MLPDRLFNFGRIAASYLVSQVRRHPWHSGMPAAVSIEPANVCNLRCPECPAGRLELTRPCGYLSHELFRRILEETAPATGYLTFYFQGEPFLNSRFFDMVREAKMKRLFVVSSTNGHFLDEDLARQTVQSGLDRLIISYDGADQESYQTYRQGGDLERVREGIRQLVKARKELRSHTPKIILQCLVLSSNEHQLGEIRRQGRELGADNVVFKTAQFYEFEGGNPLMPRESGLSRYREKSPSHQVTESQSHRVTGSQGHRVTGSQTSHVPRPTSYVVKNPLRNSCFRMWSSCVITWDGKVVPCCFDKDAGYVMGDLNSQTLREIWNGERNKEFRERVFTHRKSIDICRNCTQKW